MQVCAKYESVESSRRHVDEFANSTHVKLAVLDHTNVDRLHVFTRACRTLR